jgi:hypothetical protein
VTLEHWERPLPSSSVEPDEDNVPAN